MQCCITGLRRAVLGLGWHDLGLVGQSRARVGVADAATHNYGRDRISCALRLARVRAVRGSAFSLLPYSGQHMIGAAEHCLSEPKTT